MIIKGGAKAPRGKATSSTAQLSDLQQRLLVHLLKQHHKMQAGDAGDQVTLLNRGIPWAAHEAAKALGVPTSSASRALTSLERRGVVCCWATGEGKGRHISHIKLPAEAVAVAEHYQRYGMSRAAHLRQLKADWEARRAHDEQLYRDL